MGRPVTAEAMVQRPDRPKGLRGLHYRLYDWVLGLSAHPHAQIALFLVALVESSFFPIPPDVLLMAMCLAVPRRAVRYAVIATMGSVIGGLLGYAIGWGLWAGIGDYCFGHLGFLGFTPENFELIGDKYRANAFLALFTAGFTPIPYKVFTIAAGVFRIDLVVFVIASLLGRAGRFLLVAVLVAVGGAAIKPFIDKYLGWLTIAFVVLLIGGFWLIGRAH
jgi:membrane protein YqaA with SNARE-associated domain